MKSRTSLQKLYKPYFQNLCLSQFIQSRPEEPVKLSKYEYVMTARKKISTHFLYLFLLTQKIPVVHKRGVKEILIKSNLAKRYYLNALYQFLHTIVPTQPIVEAKIIQLQRQQVDLFLLNLPLTHKTSKLKSQSHYIASLSLQVKMIMPYASVFEKLYLLKMLKFVKLPLYVPLLYHFKTPENTKKN